MNEYSHNRFCERCFYGTPGESSDDWTYAKERLARQIIFQAESHSH
ncbi:hypothetical protein GF386_05825 [Candidatus Pacearchaeota archaeon]|nr:hypothetical protein [Candidatus Pacearchaeota archaeon]MBD3283612.1 hypothetical protein [Candidatus Pacearchaeota archaeon]